MFRRLFNALRPSTEASADATPGDLDARPVERWSDVELALEKARLEAIPEGAWNLINHLAVVDYILQRYHPKDPPPTVADWTSRRARLHAKVINRHRWVQENPDEAAEELNANAADIKAFNARLERLRSPALMSFEEFVTVLLPAVTRYDFAPTVESLHDDDKIKLYLASRPYGEQISWGEKYESRDAMDSLKYQYTGTYLTTLTELRKTFGMVKQAKTQGCTHVSIMRVTHHRSACTCGRSRLYDLPIEPILRSFGDPNQSNPLFVPDDALCRQNDDPRLCTTIVTPELPPKPGDDPEFARFMKDTFRSE